VAQARAVQVARYDGHAGMWANADAQAAVPERVATPDTEGLLRVARTIADLDGSAGVRRNYVAEAVSFRLNLSKEG
jgi:magnesium chelatase family protein